MSKFEWKDLPDWSMAEEYDFIENAAPEVKAWEFLRRNPAYRRCWRRFTTWQLAGKWAYRPKKCSDVEESTWKQASWMDGKTPTHLPIEVYLARKWGLKKLLDPAKPYPSQGGFLRVRCQYPRQITTLEHFLDFIGDEEGNMEVSSQPVMYRYGIVAYDMTRPINPQLRKTGRILLRWQKELVETGRVIVDDGRGKTFRKCAEHLRALDARCAIPPVTYSRIGQIIGKGKPWDNSDRKGKKIHTAATAAMLNYLRFLEIPPP